MRSSASNSTTRCPRWPAVVAAANPAGPAPTTAILFVERAFAMTSLVSRPARGLTRQVAFLFSNTWSRQAWLQAMQVLISSTRRVRALTAQSGSARNGRAMEIMSASPRASTASAVSGMLIRLVVTSGSLTSPRILRVTQVNAARGTEVAMVGMRVSCQPMPVLIIVAPAISIALPSCTTSCQSLPSASMSSMERR